MKGTVQLLLVFGLSLAAASQTRAAGGGTLIEFEMADQFGDKYQSSDYGDRVLIIVGSGREGSRFNPVWGKAIQDGVREEPGFERLGMLPLADLGGVPRLLRGMIRRAFPKEREKRVLLDWQGVIDEAYGLEPGHSNILVFAPTGELLLHATGRELEQPRLEEILAVLRPQLAAPGEEAQ